jgi:outer membrane protein assembly factor BamB
MAAQRDAMQEVDLEDEAPDDLPVGAAGLPSGPDDPLGRRRARLLRWWPVAVLAVAGVVATQLVLDTRERQRVDAARELDRVVGHDVGPDLVVTPVGRGWDHWRLMLGIEAGDLRVGADESTVGEPRGVTAVDATSGDVVWRTAVEATGPAPGGALPDSPVCSAGDAPVEEIRCLVQDRSAGETDASGYVAQGPLTRSRLLTLEAATGAVLAERELAPVSTAFASGRYLVVVEELEGVVQVRAEDLATGAAAWSTTLPEVPDAVALDQEQAAVFAPGIGVEAGHVFVHHAMRGAALRLSDGALEASGRSVWLGRGDRILTTGEDGYTWLRGTDGTGTARVLGNELQLTVDDGSVPGLDLLSDTRTGVGVISAVEPATGATVWSHEVSDWADGSMVLLDGVLYGADTTAVWALDARDGSVRWRTERGRVDAVDDGDGTSTWSSMWVSPMTDGRQLLLVQYDGDQPVLSAWSLASGAKLWTTALPEEAGDQLVVWDHQMYGGGEAMVRLDDAADE